MATGCGSCIAQDVAIIESSLLSVRGGWIAGWAVGQINTYASTSEVRAHECGSGTLRLCRHDVLARTRTT